MTRFDKRIVELAAIAGAVVWVNATNLAHAQGAAAAGDRADPQRAADTAQADGAREGADASSSVLAQLGTPPAPDTALVDDLLWRIGTNGENVPWNQAEAYCATLEHAGFDDWRLPTLAELEAIHDPSADTGLRAPLEIDDCCAWSSTNLVEEPAAAKGALPDPTNDPSDYYWGFLFGSGDRYYSFRSFPDGLAMCVREP
jgi:hypothetical protein